MSALCREQQIQRQAGVFRAKPASPACTDHGMDSLPAPKAGVDAPKAGVALGLPKGAGVPAPKAGVLAPKAGVAPKAGAEAPKPVDPNAGALAPKAGVDAAPKAGCKVCSVSQTLHFSMVTVCNSLSRLA